MTSVIEVVPYRTEWSARFVEEAALLRAALSTWLVAAPEHIGSTAVPGLTAKPTLDLMLGWPSYPPPADLIVALVQLGYESLGEAGVPERHYLRLRTDLAANLHVVLLHGPHWRNNLALRDYLRANPAACERYAQAKRAAVANGATTLLSYSAAKAQVVSELLAQALA